MTSLIKIKATSNVPRKLRADYTKASTAAWDDTGREFHVQHRDKRFTTAHATQAGYKPRSGEDLKGGKGFLRSYTGRKLKKYGHTRPLEKTGESRRAVSMATIRSNSKSVKVAYPGARKFNFRSAYTDINMADEFRRILPSESTSLAKTYETSLAARFKKDQ